MLILEYKLLWPVAGIFVGWVLKEISSNLSQKKITKQNIGNSLYHLLIIHNEMNMFISSSIEVKKNSKDIFAGYEQLKNSFDLFFNNSDFFKKSYETINSLSNKYPVISYRLKICIDGHMNIRKLLQLEKELKTEDFDNAEEESISEEDISNIFEEIQTLKKEIYQDIEEILILNKNVETKYRKILDLIIINSIIIKADMNKIISKLLMKHSISTWLDFKLPKKFRNEKYRKRLKDFSKKIIESYPID